MCTVLLPPGVNPTAVKYTISINIFVFTVILMTRPERHKGM
jgi:hypothetical protein